MNYYVDIRILLNPELLDAVLMSNVFSRLHKTLCSQGQEGIGISFPNFNKNLGDILRLHGTKNSLQDLMCSEWMGHLIDYTTVSGILIIPETVVHRVVKRVQVKSSQERLLRRSIRKGWLTEEEAALRLEEKCDKKLTLPFVQLKSVSTEKMFRLFIEHGSIVSQSAVGSFNAYGLSSNATIPWF